MKISVSVRREYWRESFINSPVSFTRFKTWPSSCILETYVKRYRSRVSILISWRRSRQEKRVTRPPTVFSPVCIFPVTPKWYFSPLRHLPACIWIHKQVAAWQCPLSAGGFKTGEGREIDRGTPRPARFTLPAGLSLSVRSPLSGLSPDSAVRFGHDTAAAARLAVYSGSRIAGGRARRSSGRERRALDDVAPDGHPCPFSNA